LAAKVNQAVLDCSACVFNNKYIFKFGGVSQEKKLTKIIEKYDVGVDKWSLIKYTVDPNLSSEFQILKNAITV
jgi:hypothetical protein